MSNLANQYISSSYQSVLNIGTTAGASLSSSLQPVTDGFGLSSPLSLATDKVAINGTVYITGSIIPQGSGSWDLGGVNNPFRHGYFSSGSLYLDNNRVLGLDNVNNTTIAAPGTNAITLLNNIIFDSEGESNTGGSWTMVGRGDSRSTNTNYDSDFNFVNTNGNLFWNNRLDNSDTTSTGSYGFSLYNGGQFGVGAITGAIQMSTEMGQINLLATGSEASINIVANGFNNQMNLDVISGSMAIVQDSPDRNHDYNILAKGVNHYEYGTDVLQWNIGAWDKTGSLFDNELLIKADINGLEWKDWNSGSNSYSNWMTQAPNNGDNPQPVFTRGLVSSGSLSVEGNGSFVGAVQSSDVSIGPQYYAPTVFQGVGTTAVAYDQFVNDGNYDAIHIQSNLNDGTIFQDYNQSGLDTWLHVPTNTGSNPAPIFTRGLTVTGSLDVTNIIGTGSLFLQPNQNDARFLEVYNTSPTDTHITASGGQLFLGNDVTYVKVDNYGSVKRIDVVADNGTNISGSVGITGSINVEGNGSIVGTIQASDANYGPQYFAPTVFQGVGGSAVAYDQFVNDGNYDSLHIQSNLNDGTVFQDYNNDSGLSTWLHIPTNPTTEPAPIFTRGLVVSGSLTVTGGINYASGSNKTMGTVALNGGNPGTATVSNSLVTTASLIFLTKQTYNHSAGIVGISAKSNGSFTIASGHNGDTDVVAYQIINPA